MLVLSRLCGESIIIGDCVKVTLLKTSDGSARIGIDAPKDISVWREELWRGLQSWQDQKAIDQAIEEGE